MAPDDRAVQDLADLTELWSVAAQAYMDGDLRRYAAVANHAPDYTLIPPNGGDPREGFDGSDQAVEWTANTFRGGDTSLEVFASYASGDLAVLVATPSDSTAPSATCRARSGHCGSLSSSAVTVTTGGSCTGTPTRRPISNEVLAEIARGEHAASRD